jgi:hypothetical protein
LPDHGKIKHVGEDDKLCLDTKIERHDAVGLVHRAWLKSFMKVERNHQAIAECGWNPLNYKLLDHEELHRIRDINSVKIQMSCWQSTALTFLIPAPQTYQQASHKQCWEKMLIITSKKRP